MKKFFKKMRGEITTSQLVTFILLLVGFVILMIVFYNFAFTGVVDRQTCHESVILRATLSALPGGDITQGFIPLKCTTKNTCVTTKLLKKGNCEEFENKKGLETARVSKKEEIEKYLAQEVLECWETMGEGKVDLFSSIKANFGVGKVQSSCVICTRVAFDGESLEKENINLSEVFPYDYMSRYRVPGKEISYIEEISGSSGNSFLMDRNNPINTIIVPKGEKGETESLSVTTEGTSKVQTNELAVIFMQISAPSQSEVWKNLGVAGATAAGTAIAVGLSPGGNIIWTPVKWVIGAIGAAKAAVIGAAIAVIGGVYVTANTYSNQELSVGKCEGSLIGEEARTGCSVVRITSYNVSDLTKYCNIVEGI